MTRQNRGGLTKLYGKEYKAWHSMVQRCTNPQHARYKRYGGRGITVCRRWLRADGFQAFLTDIKPCPDRSLSLDRVDNDGNYEPNNVRWASAKTQSNNFSRNRRLLFNGQKKTIREWSHIFGLNEQTVHERLKRGWSVEAALETKPGTAPGKKSRRAVTFNGETKTLREWASVTGLPERLLVSRYHTGMPPEKILSTRPLPRGKAAFAQAPLLATEQCCYPGVDELWGPIP